MSHKIRERSKEKIKAKPKGDSVHTQESIAEKGYGIFKVKKWPKDLDKYLEEAVQKELAKELE